MRDKIFYSICFGFIFGVLWRSFVLVNFYIILFILLLAGALLIYFSILKNFSSIKYHWDIIFVVFVLAFSFGIFRFQMVDVSAPSVFESQVGKNASFSGEIIDEPDVREDNQKLTIEAVVGGEKTQILATVNLDENFKYGDQVNFSGKLEKPENFITDQGKNFDYINYLKKDGIFYLVNYADIEIVSRGNGNPLKSMLFSLKEKFLSRMSFAIRQPEGLLMSGLILGEKASFSQEMRQKFIDTGTIHIVALSGYNISIVAEWLMKLFSFLPKNFSLGAGFFGIILFVIMSGGSSTAIRAGIMAVLVLVARLTGRDYGAARALLFAGVLMILFNPFILAYDVSFELSFIATAAIIFLQPKFKKYFMWVTPRFGLREVFSSTFAAYMFVLPFILYKMGSLSVVALPANILILPFIPFTMMLGFLTGISSFFHYLLGVPLGFISYLFLHYELSVIDFFSRFPFASYSIHNFPLFLTLLIYACFIYKFFGKSIKEFFKFYSSTAPLENSLR